MAFYIVVSGTKLYRVNTAGAATELTLPTGITLDVTRRPRMAVMGRNVVVNNVGIRSFFVDPNFNVYPQQIQPPVSPPILTSASTGVLSATVGYRVKYSYLIKDPLTNNVLVESQLSPASASSGTFSLKLLKADGLAASPDRAVTHRRLYRTTDGTSTYFPWFDLEGNTLTSASDDISDALLDDFAAPTELGVINGCLPYSYCTLLVEWKGRLWAVTDTDPDYLRYCAAGLFYAWKSSYQIPITPIGFDQFGITGFIRRKNELGVGRRNVLWKITGDDTTNFQPVIVHEQRGIFSSESVVVIDDVGWFLSEDGVYTWGPDGVECKSDAGNVRKWFNTDTYFNRALFSSAFGKYNQKYDGYELHMAAAGSSVIDRWVFCDRKSGKWYGPHKTAAFTPTTGIGQFIDSNSLTVPLLGSSDGKLFVTDSPSFNDNGSAISLSGVGVRTANGTPDIEKLFKRPSFIFKRQAAKGDLVVAGAIGEPDCGETIRFEIDQRGTRERFPVLGHGRFCSLTFTESTLDQGCEIQGYEIPAHELGRR